MNNDKSLGHLQAALTISILCLIIYFVIRPIAFDTYEKYLQAEKYNENIKKMKRNLQSINTIDRINRDYKDEIALIDRVIPIKSEEQDFIKNLSILCGKNNINLIRTGFTHLNDSVIFDLELEGRYDNLPILLEDINNMLRLTVLEQIAVSEVKDAPAKGAVYINTQGRIFKRIQENE
jgi:hypothetical protein